uniref:Beta-lactamase domain-containing protein n=1 Tax=Rhabditophanes sp. KR3021 TaxID=114890 RepID=A0AC35U3B7_9BILA
MIQLPSVADYKAKISYIPVEYDKSKLKYKPQDREKFGENHFKCSEVKTWSSLNNKFSKKSKISDIKRVLIEEQKTTKIPLLKDPIPENGEWVVIEEKVIGVSVLNMSHLGSDLIFIPSATLEEDILYLAIIKWEGLKSRIDIGWFLDAMNCGNHLDYPFFEIIPVRAVRIEPIAGHCTGQIAIDGEPCKPGQSFQIYSTSKFATLTG